MRPYFLSILAILSLVCSLPAQSPVVVPAAAPAVPKSVPATSESVQGALKMLQEMKAANEEMLRKQAATLQELDELEKVADQIRLYTRRS